MFTANTMNCLTEALGLGLPGNGTIPAVDKRRRQLAKNAGEQIMELLEKDIRPSKIINTDAVHNAFTVDMALGGSTNSVLHVMAVAYEAGVEFTLDMIDKVSNSTPQLCKLSPASGVRIEDLDKAGGIPAVMKEVEELLKLDSLTVTGKPVRENIIGKQVFDSEVIRPRSDPFSSSGGLAILFGNLAPDGAVVKKGAVDPEMMVHSGPARVFEPSNLVMW
jgi:dihydroxy-acid dehydratase